MKKQKSEKGITLVALIITIIILLILAVVAINAVQDDGIISYAKNSRNEYEKSQANESILLGNYTNYIKENTVEIIKFTIQLQDSSTEPIECEAEKGMDFYTWCNSEYNNTTLSSSKKEWDVGGSYEQGNEVGGIWLKKDSFLGERVKGSTVIEEGKTYYGYIEWYD